MTDFGKGTLPNEQAAENSTVSDKHSLMSPLKARLLGLFLLLVGIGSSIALKVAHDQGGGVYEKWILLTPALCTYGLAGIIYPRVIQTAHGDENGKTVPLPYIIAGVGFIIGLFVRYVVFKDWK